MTEKAPARRKTARPTTATRGPAPVDVDALPTLTLDDVRDENERQLISRGVAYVREYAAIEHKPTIILRNLAVTLVALRQQFTDSEGRPDMLGRSYEYRQAAGELYRQAGVTDASRDRVQVAVRWHVGNVIRDVMSSDELEKYELIEKSPTERLRDSRATRAAIVAASRAEITASTAKEEGPTVKATADYLRLATAVQNILGQLDAEVITGQMTDGQRAKLDDYLADVQKRVAALRRLTRKRTSEG